MLTPLGPLGEAVGVTKEAMHVVEGVKAAVEIAHAAGEAGSNHEDELPSCGSALPPRFGPIPADANFNPGDPRLPPQHVDPHEDPDAGVCK